MTHIDIKNLIEYESKGKIKRSKHPKYELYIWNYSEKVQYNRDWDWMTKKCRGLITDNNGNIVAHSFMKFFNIEEQMHSSSFEENYEVYEKLDGSLGILFYYNNEWIFSSRGSFISKQAQKGEQFIKQFNLDRLNKNLSYIFETIYPENKIVVDYNDKEAVIFLTAFNKKGEEINVENDIQMLGIEIVNKFKKQDPYILKHQNIPNKEGYVLKFTNGERVKIKFENYIKLHKLISNLTVKNILKWMCTLNKNSILDKIPDEYYNWFYNLQNEINNQYKMIYDICETDFKKYYTINKKDFANAIKEHKYKNILFLMFDNKNKEDPNKTIMLNKLIYKNMDYKYLSEKYDIDNTDTIKYKRHGYQYIEEKISDKKIIQNINNPKCIIFDLDGTLALIKENGRSPYNMMRVNEDILNTNIYEIYNCIRKDKTFKIIICTGRSEEAYHLTIDWLKLYNIEYDNIYFRPLKNRQPDYLIKELMWRKISKEYYIITLFDDRNQVVNHARKLGLIVCQVADGNF